MTRVVRISIFMLLKGGKKKPEIKEIIWWSWKLFPGQVQKTKPMGLSAEYGFGSKGT